MADQRTQYKQIDFSGKLRTCEPVVVGADFRTLKNMRYADGHVRMVQGMTKINTVALTTYLKTRNAFHFRKAQPAESHVLVQAYNTDLTASQVLENTTAIPSAGAFSATALHTDSAGAGRGFFSDAPDGHVVYCNGIDACIWGGNESKIGAMVRSSAAVTDTGAATSPRDYTAVANNTKSDGENVIPIGGGIDTYVGLMLHGNGSDASTTFTDSSTAGAAKTVSALGGTDTQIDTSFPKFGSGAIIFDGTGDGLTTADHADFHCADSAFTYDLWIRFGALPAENQAMVLYSQRANVSNSAIFTLKNLGGRYTFDLMLKTAGANAYPVKDAVWASPAANTWYHIALIRGWGGSANSWTVTVAGANLGAQTSAATYPNVAAAFQIGAGTSEVISSYPPAHDGTYVKSTTYYDSNRFPFFATDPSRALTGVDTGAAWAANGKNNQRFHIDLGAATVVTRIYYENYHQAGTDTDMGAKTFTFWGSNDSTAFDELTYGVDTNWTQLTCSQATFDQHAAADSADPKYITVTNTTAYRYYAFKIADNWGDPAVVGIRRIELNPVSVIAFNGHMDEIRWSHTSAGGGIARWTSDFTPSAIEYSAPARVWLLGTTRPVKGFKYTVSKANTTASTMSGKVWNGSTWATLTITDNTTDTGASLAQTGTVTFPSTVGTAKPKYLEGYFLYWYQFEIDAGEAEISHITMDAPFQNIVDMWDGVFRDVVRFYEYKTAYVDYTLNVLKDDYDADTASTYYDVGGLDAWSSPNNAIEIGFSEKQTGLQIKMAVPNAVASTVLTVEYWNGSEYAEVGTLTDGTSEGGISLKKTGVVSWNNNSLANEMMKVVSNSPPLYFYRLRWNQNITDGARINYVGGISAQKSISHFKFPVFAQGRVLLCADMAGDKNKALVSPKFMPQVYNGADSVEIWFGEDGELTCGVELFSQFGSSLYSLVLMFKDHETWVMAGADIEQWQDNTYLLSSSIGCPAPQTLKSINLAAEPGAGVNRSLAIWQGANGIYMSDGRAPIPIHGDIKEYFDRTDTRCIKASMVGDSVGWIDPDKNEYHWLFASGTAATTLNTELVYDIARNRWFEIDRTADLQCGVLVYDTDGNPYTYGFLDTGYMERLEYGNTFDEGVSITGTVHFGDMALAGLQTETRVENVRLFTVAKTTTGNEVTCTHYAGTGTVETAVASRGLLTVNSPPTLGDQFTIDTTTFTIVTTRSATGQVTFSANVNTQASNIATAINADMTTVTASASTDKVTVTAATAGSAGNLIVFASSTAKISANGSGLLGGTTEGADASAIAKTMSPARTGYRVAIPEFQDKLDGDPFHSFKFAMSTADETIGFEPLSMVLAYHATHQD